MGDFFKGKVGLMSALSAGVVANFAAYLDLPSSFPCVRRLRAYFFCLSKRNRRKKKTPGYSALRVPCASRLQRGCPYGASCPGWTGPTSLSVPFGLFPLPTAMLGGIHGTGEATPTPFDAAEHRSDLRIRPEGAPQGSSASIAGEGAPVDGAPEIVRSAGNPQGKSPGGFSLVTFFWATKRKLLATPARKEEQETNLDRLRNWLLKLI